LARRRGHLHAVDKPLLRGFVCIGQSQGIEWSRRMRIAGPIATLVPCSASAIVHGMCGRFTQNYTWSEPAELYALTQPPRNLAPRYSIAPMTMIDVVRVHQGARACPHEMGADPGVVEEGNQRSAGNVQCARGDDRFIWTVWPRLSGQLTATQGFVQSMRSSNFLSRTALAGPRHARRR
jgi:hypothetical protein